MWCPSLNRHQTSGMPSYSWPLQTSHCKLKHPYSPGRERIATFFKSIQIDTLVVSISFLNRLSLNRDVVFFTSSCLMLLPIELLQKCHFSEVNFFLRDENVTLPLLKYLTFWPSTVAPDSSHSTQYHCQEREGNPFLQLPLTLTTDSAVIHLRERQGDKDWVLLCFLQNSYLVIIFTCLMRTPALWIFYIFCGHLPPVSFPCLFISFLFLLRALVMQCAKLNQGSWLFL